MNQRQRKAPLWRGFSDKLKLLACYQACVTVQVAVVELQVMVPVPGSRGLKAPGAAVLFAAGESQAWPPNGGRAMSAKEAATQEFE